MKTCCAVSISPMLGEVCLRAVLLERHHDVSIHRCMFLCLQVRADLTILQGCGCLTTSFCGSNVVGDNITAVLVCFLWCAVQKPTSESRLLRLPPLVTL
jgi:hypothetical protein